ncbi:unnamed protein product [Lactuca virosa]|uniref:DUF659 domain-containing protein n=1 Tax=Lactuca virosa TaxID=75947 RepID=A0AAU9NVN0_9ASTR|nr:unnamed protein product [Lactuca virosa]
MGAAKLLKEKRPKIFRTSCATHTINLMLEGIGGLPRFKKVLDQEKQLTIFIYAHHKTLAMMRKFTNKRDIIRPGVTRFASAYLTLQSLSEKKEQLRHMFSSNKWEECKFSNAVKGRSSHTLVTGSTFWAGVVLCLKVFSPLVKVLRMVDADWKPSMGFVYGEIQKAKKEIIDALGGNKKAYEPIINIISKKMKDGVGIVGDGQGTDELGQSSRTRELLDEDFASGSEEEVFEEVDYELDGVHIMKECGDKE